MTAPDRCTRFALAPGAIEALSAWAAFLGRTAVLDKLRVGDVLAGKYRLLELRFADGATASFRAVDTRGHPVDIEILGDGRTPPPGSGIDCGTTPDGLAFVVFAPGRSPAIGVPPSLTPNTQGTSALSPLASTQVSPKSEPIESAQNEGHLFAERFRIETCIGRGGMGEVYRARDEKLNRVVALKVVRYSSTDEATRQRAAHLLLREARAAATLTHPNVVTLFDVGEVDQVPYLAMEYVEGTSLRNCVGDESVPMESRVRWLQEIATALAAAHARGIAHRDIKPENVMITSDGVAKVLDFGIAKELSTSGVTHSGMIVGSPAYMAPEQLCGADVDARCDQYAWALVAHELLFGNHPYAREISARGPAKSAPPPFDTVMRRALAQDRDARYPTMDALLDALARGTAAAPPGVSPSGRMTRRGLRSAITLGTLVAGVIAVGATFLLTSPPPTKPAEIAKPDAVTTLGAAKQLWRDASIEEALRRIGQATEIDPAYAEAHLRYALFDDVTPAAREHFHQAAQFRDRLQPSEQALLNALGPSLQEPFDVLETRRRLEALVTESPNDVELLLAVASRYLSAWNGAGALPFVERAMRASKQPLAVASYYRARSLAKLSRFDEARAEYDRCFASSPSATGCLHGRARIDANDGRCDSTEQLGRRLAATNSSNAYGPQYLAGALFAQGQSLPPARAALEPWWATLSGPEGEWLRSRDQAYLDVLAGDFGAAEHSIAVWEQSAVRFSDADHHGEPAVFRLLMYLELGMDRDVDALAHRYLDQSRAWSQGNRIVFDIEAYRMLYFASAISKPEFDKLRNEWLGRADANWRGLYDPLLYKWYEAYIEPVRDADDARLALSKRPPELVTYDHEIFNSQGNEKLGLMYGLAGQDRDAFDHLRKSATACTFNHPIHQTMGVFHFGNALARSGDTSAACTEYAKVLRRWGGEPRSVTAAAARATARELGCALPRDVSRDH